MPGDRTPQGDRKGRPYYTRMLILREWIGEAKPYIGAGLGLPQPWNGCDDLAS